MSKFQQITRYNSKMVQERCIVPTRVEQEVVGTLSNGNIASDLLFHVRFRHIFWIYSNDSWANLIVSDQNT